MKPLPTHCARVWLVRGALALWLVVLSGCFTNLLWDRRSFESSEDDLFNDTYLAAPELQRIAVRLPPHRLERIRHELPFLGETATTLWIDSVESGALERVLRRATEVGGGLVLTCETHVTSSLWGDDCECTLMVWGTAAHAWMAAEPGRQVGQSGDQWFEIRCRVSAGTAFPAAAEAPVDKLMLLTSRTKEPLPVVVCVVLSPLTILFDVILAPIQLPLLWYLSANRY